MVTCPTFAMWLLLATSAAAALRSKTRQRMYVAKITGLIPRTRFAQTARRSPTGCRKGCRDGRSLCVNSLRCDGVSVG